MKSSDFRAVAREHLKGKWGKVAILTLIFFIIACILSVITENVPTGIVGSIISIAILIIEIPLSFGFSFALYKVYKGEDIKYLDFLSLGFNNLKKSWGIALNILLKMIVPILVMIVLMVVIIALGITAYNSSLSSGNLSPNLLFSAGILGLITFIAYIAILIWIIVRAYLFIIANYIAFDNLELSSKDVVLRSQKLMQGNRGKYFILSLTFIGWALLAMLLLGIGFLWLLPYVQFATFAFYDHLKEN